MSSTTKDWFTNTLHQPMTLSQKRALLKKLESPSVLQSLRRPHLLLDFFTDNLDPNSPDYSLPLAIQSLAGLFTLLTVHNLDYPNFYPTLYSLLTPDLLHSKYRSRLIRHLDTFLSPTNHIPASTIASFIKRLSRLSLFAPPAAIVAIIPFIYNLLKSHPTCTFMLHRHPHPPYLKPEHVPTPGIDPFDPQEPDPSKTNAIDSSLWELHTLQDHYNPTVAQICRIMSEQFTKQQYNLEDFLDHGYVTMLGSELKKEGRRVPVVEWKIPTKVFEREDEGEGKEQPDNGVNGESRGKKRARNALLDNWSFY